MIEIVLFIKIIFIHLLVWPIATENVCELQQSIMDDVYGNNNIGIFAGKNYKTGDIVEVSPISRLSHESAKNNILDEYVMGYNSSHVSLVFGYACIYNHGETRSVGNFIYEEDDDDDSEKSGLRDGPMIAEIDINQGDEIFFNYGETWFESRNIHHKKVVERPAVRSRRDIPGCPQYYTYIDNRKLYAKRAIPKDTIIEVARSLLVPHEAWREKELRNLVWLFPNSSKTSMGVLNLGWGAFYSAYDKETSTSLDDDDEANVKYSTWNSNDPHDDDNDYDGEGDNNNINASPDSDSLLGNACKEKFFILFKSAREINAHEELTINLDTHNDEGLKYATELLEASCNFV